ncbi:MAG TPA: response regulator transcription factor [Acetivibrio sp.]|nr:response regulator transcription factor [Acetivibrio sp.]
MHKILIIEDDTTIANIIGEHLASWGMETRCVTDFQNVLSDFAEFSPHLVLIDISLPFYNGYHWCSEIRKISKVPIIFISSASDNMNIVMAINMGADDFIAKPFDLTVLVAKVQALLRRTYDFTYGTDVLEHKGVILNLSDCSLMYQGNKLELTRNEQRILQVLLEQKGKVVSRDTLMYRLWETDDFIDENTLTVNITRLRKKLAGVGIEEFIITKKGMGYVVE